MDYRPPLATGGIDRVIALKNRRRDSSVSCDHTPPANRVEGNPEVCGPKMGLCAISDTLRWVRLYMLADTWPSGVANAP